MSVHFSRRAFSRLGKPEHHRLVALHKVIGITRLTSFLETGDHTLKNILAGGTTTPETVERMAHRLQCRQVSEHQNVKETP